MRLNRKALTIGDGPVPSPEDAQPMLTVDGLDEHDAILTTTDDPLGLTIDAATMPKDLPVDCNRFSTIAISIPSFGDGRGFSTARRFRDAGFTGVLRAVGPVIPDQLAALYACGFDEIDVPDAHFTRHGETSWAIANVSMSLSYQRGYNLGVNVLERRAQLASAKSPTRQPSSTHQSRYAPPD